MKAGADSAMYMQLETMTRALNSDANGYDRYKAEQAAIRLGKKYFIGYQDRDKRSITGLLRIKVRDGLALYPLSFPKPIRNCQGSDGRAENSTEATNVEKKAEEVEDDLGAVQEEEIEVEESVL